MDSVVQRNRPALRVCANAKLFHVLLLIGSEMPNANEITR